MIYKNNWGVEWAKAADNVFCINCCFPPVCYYNVEKPEFVEYQLTKRSGQEMTLKLVISEVCCFLYEIYFGKFFLYPDHSPSLYEHAHARTHTACTGLQFYHLLFIRQHTESVSLRKSFTVHLLQIISYMWKRDYQQRKWTQRLKNQRRQRQIFSQREATSAQH